MIDRANGTDRTFDHTAGPSAPGMPRMGGSTTSAARMNLLDLLERSGLILLLIVVIIVFSILRPETFATAANWRSIANTQPVLAVAAMALIVPLIAGRFDVSVGANLGLCAIATAAAMSRYGLPLEVAMIIGVAIGALIGLFNGYIVAYLGVNSIIGTLGVSTILGGLVNGYTGGIPISDNLSPLLTNISVQTVAGVPVLFVIMIIIGAATWFLLTQTPYGRYLSAVGANIESARLTGIRVKWVVLRSFVIAGALAGIGGILEIGSQGNAGPDLIGITFILPALAAAFLGATTWRPGHYSVQGTIIALFFLGTTISGLELVGTEPWITDVFNGAAVVLAIAMSAQLRRRRTGSVEIGR
jgi:ribose transport system permease protein